MAYDEALAQRIRRLLNEPEVAERKMFGGLAFRLAFDLPPQLDREIATSHFPGARCPPTEPGEPVMTSNPARGCEMLRGQHEEQPETRAAENQRGQDHALHVPRAPTARS